MEKICEEKHKRIDEKIKVQDKQIYNHDIRIDKLERICAEDRVMINNLCKQIESLVTTIKFVGGPLFLGIIGFFFYALQQGLLNN